MIAEGMLPHELMKLGQEVAVAAELELGVYTGLGEFKSQLGQALQLRSVENRRQNVLQRSPAPQIQRVCTQRRSAAPLADLGGFSRFDAEMFKFGEAELSGVANLDRIT